MTAARRWAAPAVLLAVLISLPFWTPSRYWVSVAIQALILAVFAMSLDLLLGFGGMPSFGHAAFYGMGAYACGKLFPQLSGGGLLAFLAAGMAAGVIAALPIGALAVRARGIYFLMLTLAFAQMVWGLAFQWTSFTGGTEGMSGIPQAVPDWLQEQGQNVWPALRTAGPFYVVALTVAVLAFAGLTAITRSPFGRALEGIRENEGRMRALGYPTYRYRLAAFVIAAAFAGLAGATTALYNGYANPSQLYWHTSGLVLIAVIVGGTRSLLGAVLGAFFVTIVQLVISSYTEHWQLLLGAVFIAVVLFLPGGLVSLGRLGWHRR